MIIKTKRKEKLFYLKFKEDSPDCIYTEENTLLPAIFYVFKNLKNYLNKKNTYSTDKYYYHNL